LNYACNDEVYVWLEFFRVAYLDAQHTKVCLSKYFTLTALGKIRIALVSFRAVALVPGAIDCIHTIAV
jgi:hypothetical protein